MEEVLDTEELDGGSVGDYYGIINGYFHFWSIDEIRKYNAEIIELPKESTYPRVMLVSQDNIDYSNRRVVFMEKKTVYF